ncbi:MAG: VanZ family protein, partial [Chitinophagaceae bacterium]|nr:VanZ family protein [Chitinophagaceae bacterium]
MKRASFYLPVIFFAISFILLVLPGNELPKSKLFFNGFDKIVHILLFSVLTFLFCRPFKLASANNEVKSKWFVIITLGAIIYGALMEFVQLHFVPFRSFELGDILADTLGALSAFIYSRKTFLENKIKKVGPDRNR